MSSEVDSSEWPRQTDRQACEIRVTDSVHHQLEAIHTIAEIQLRSKHLCAIPGYGMSCYLLHPGRVVVDKM
jgi:hypothetical protein